MTTAATQQFEVLYTDRVRYSDCDMHGHMNNARYITFMEQARVGYLDAVGMTPDARKESIPFILVHVSCDYRSSAVISDDVITGIHVSEFGRTSCTMHYQMTRANDGLVFATGKTIQVMFDFAANAPMPITAAFKQSVWALQDARGVARTPERTG